MKQSPPQFATKVLRWFVNAEFLEEVEGDLDELFQERLSSHGLFNARLYYFLNVLQAIKPYPAKRKSKVAHEIIHLIFLKLAYRNLLKRKGYSFINTIGLSIGLVSFLLIMEYVLFEKSYDSFHSRSEKIFRIAFNWGETDYKGNNSSIYASSVPALGPELVEELPEIEAFTRFVPVLTVKPYSVFTYRKDGQIKFSGNVDNGFYADENFLKIFSFSIAKGATDPLAEPQSVVITESFAQKIFGDRPRNSIIGAMLEVDNHTKSEHIITAILEDPPPNSHIQFDYLISYATINSDRLEGNLGWSQFYTYVLCKSAVTNELMLPKFEQLIDKLYGKESHIAIFLQPLTDIYLTSNLREELPGRGSNQHLIFLTIVACAILAMAWINYINMFLARSFERANEVGVKKVLGSSRVHLIIQFLTESLVIHVISFSISVLLLVLVQPFFEAWLGKNISIVFYEQVPLVVLLFAGLIVGSILIGLYPGFVISSHQPVQTLGAKVNSSRSGIFFNKSLVYFQFIVSFSIVSGTLIVNRQLDFMKDADLGMELSGRIAIRSPGTLDTAYQYRLQLLKERLLHFSDVKDVSVTSSIPGKRILISGGIQRLIGPELGGNNVFNLQVDENFLSTYDIKLIAGKNFSKAPAGGVPTVLLNEAALKTLKFESPQDAIHHRIHWQRKEFEIIGIFSNYNHLFLKEDFEPIMLSYNPVAVGYITLAIEKGKETQALAIARNEMQILFPENPFEYDFLESAYNYQYQPVQQFEFLTKYFASLAIFIACLGLFALSSYSVQRRIKEIAVRKVFGAGIKDVFLMLSKRYVWIALISSVLGSSFTFYIMKQWLQNFAFAIDLTFDDFFLPLVAIIVITLLTVSYNCIQASLANPSRSLKHH